MSAPKRDDIDHLIELHDVYDGWSIAVLNDGTLVNRWAGYADYARRAEKTQHEIDKMLTERSTP